ncbi:MAG: N-acetylmuramoyl-L-alanine amidase [Actinobacteria bacterium]|nr:N-acetylmuramoyl-L-alanine amidase [Actinomycetota bacterium]
MADRATARTWTRWWTIVRVTTLVAVVAALSLPGRLSPPGDAPTSRVRSLTVDTWAAADADGWHRAPAVQQHAVLVGADWDATAGIEVEVRGRDTGGWGPWFPVDVDADGDHDTASGPVWLGQVQAFQFRVRGDTPALDVTRISMDGDAGLAYDPLGRPGAAYAAPATPEFVSRSQWDPNGECRPRTPARYATDVQMAYVHHTAIFPNYAPEEADDVVRAICLFHVRQRGWSDIGYNFLIDRYGRVFEGRAGGVERPVVGAHASGFNERSVGVSVIGDFDTQPVPAPALEGLARVIAWKAAVHGLDPVGWTDVVTSTDVNPKLSRYRPGSTVTVPVVSGHLDTAANTSCPGRHLYAVLGDVRQRAAELAAAWPDGPPLLAAGPTAFAADGTDISAVGAGLPPGLRLSPRSALQLAVLAIAGSTRLRYGPRSDRGDRPMRSSA